MPSFRISLLPSIVTLTGRPFIASFAALAAQSASCRHRACLRARGTHYGFTDLLSFSHRLFKRRRRRSHALLFLQRLSHPSFGFVLKSVKSKFAISKFSAVSWARSFTRIRFQISEQCRCAVELKGDFFAL